MEKFLTDWDVAFDEQPNSKSELYEALAEKLQEHNNNVELLWRLVRVTVALANNCKKVGDKTEWKKYSDESLKYAKKAIQYGPNSFDAHKWYCASVGQMTSLVSPKERIKFGHEFKEHRDIAVAINPNDRLMNHMYGRWCFGIASLTYLERKIAKTFFATPPVSSYEEALESLLKADDQSPDWKANQLWLAKVYIALKEYNQAIKCIDHGLEVPIASEDDAMSQIELQELEKSYAKYRN